MPPKYEYKSGMKVGSWILVSPLGKGGNGEVWKARNNGSEAAIKILAKIYRERYERFRREVEFLTANPSEGILPISNFNLPDKPTHENPAWLAMPIATPIRDALGDNPTPEIVVEAIANIAETLAQLHERGISHRDIKPDNLYQFDGRWVIGDFGLVKLPEKSQITKEGEKLGPLHFMAPEMIEGADDEDGRSADVYSMAKTLWVLAVSDGKYPPQGWQLASDPVVALRSYINHPKIIRLDFLIERATKNNPSERISMQDFSKELRGWSTPSIAISYDSDDLTDLALNVNPLIKHHAEIIPRTNESRNLAISQAEEICKTIENFISIIEQSMRNSSLDVFVHETGTYMVKSLHGVALEEITEAKLFHRWPDFVWGKIIASGISITDFGRSFYSAILVQLTDVGLYDLNIIASHFSYSDGGFPLNPSSYFYENHSRLKLGYIDTDHVLEEIMRRFKEQLKPSLEKYFSGLKKV